jgi:acyl-CoA synthetase (NDP forming)
MTHLDGDLPLELAGLRPAMDSFLRPQAIAVVGASSDPGTLSGLLFANLAGSGFGGAVLPVNKRHPSVQGVAAYPDLVSCPIVPDLVVVCVPAPAVGAVIAEAGELGVKAVCVISAGFAETGQAGSDLQDALARQALAHGTRLVGPNCAGVVGGEGDLWFNATFGRRVPPPGNISVISQSGAFGLGVLEMMGARGLGLRSFVSIGNTADLGIADFLLYWGQDPGTELVLIYLESVPEPRRFLRVAKQVSARVPIVVLKAGRTDAGRRGAASHTAALSSGDVAVGALLRQAGVIRAESVEEVLDLAALLSLHHKYPGRRVGIVTNGGGSGVIAADACESNGLVVPEVSLATADRLRAWLPAEASVANPVDMIASADEGQYREVAQVVGRSGDIDVLMVVFNVPVLTPATAVARELSAVQNYIGAEVPIVAVFLNRDGPPPSLRQAGIPSFVFPEGAARALAAVVTWNEARDRLPVEPLQPRVRPASVGTLLAEARLRARHGWLSFDDTQALLETYGIAVPKSVVVRTPLEAELAQAKFCCPVVVKVATAIHKSDVGGVRLDVTTPKAAADAVQGIRADLGDAGAAELGHELVVQEQVTAGQEMIAGFNRDPLLGPLVVAGLGGKLVELMGDVAVRVSPLTDVDVVEMVQSLRSYPLLTGYRGSPALDLDAFHNLLKAVSAVAEECPEIAEMDLNPVFVLEKGAIVVDARVGLHTLLAPAG